ncbi:MAG: arsenite methyltransferase [Anaerolineae bacterium]
MAERMAEEQIKQAVRERYGGIARRMSEESGGGTVVRGCCGSQVSETGQRGANDCCGSQAREAGRVRSSNCCGPTEVTVGEGVAARFYSAEELFGLPDSVTDASLGCGNPLAIAQLKTGEAVLDLGSGGGIDCFLAARQVGPEGRVIGLDMTPDMIKLARRNAKELGMTNVDFRYGEMEEMPIPDDSVDTILSNCVINLSPDKDAVFREAYRVLRPGGRLSVSDIVVDGNLPQPVRDSLSAWAGCISGALDEQVYLDKIRAAGFEGIEIMSRDWTEFDDALDWEGVQVMMDGPDLRPHDLAQKVVSIKVRAYKPK